MSREADLLANLLCALLQPYTANARVTLVSNDFGSALPRKELPMDVSENVFMAKKKIAKASFMWVIEIFSYCWQWPGLEIASSKFHSHGSWYLELETASENDSVCEGQFLNLYLHYVDSRKTVSAEVTLCVVDVGNNDCLKWSTGVLLFTNGSSSCRFLGTITRSGLNNHAAQLLPHDELTIRCDLTFIDYAFVRSEHQRTSVSVADCQLSEDLSWLLESGSCADVTMNVGNGAYRVHKAILASRSPVFRAMFEHDMLEKLRGEVFVPDIEYEVLGELLRFIYTGRSPNLHDMADALMVTADKYGLQYLRDACEDALTRSLSIESAASSLIVADKLNATTLRQSSLNFICANLCEVTKTAGWMILVDDHIDLALDVYIAALPECCTDTIEPPAKRSRPS